MFVILMEVVFVSAEGSSLGTESTSLSFDLLYLGVSGQ